MRAEVMGGVFLLAPMPVIGSKVGCVSTRLHLDHTKNAGSHLRAVELRTRWLFLLTPMPVIEPMVSFEPHEVGSFGLACMGTGGLCQHPAKDE
jgi:hypothetical protein